MATVENTTVKVYKGVPLIKGGTEVLYLAQGAAESALSGFLFKTYTRYYYQRENRGYIQIEDTIDELEGANYVSFVNASHGSKIYFAFVDRLVYINDEVTQIEYSIDPFPTYLADTTERYPVFVERNSPSTRSAAAITSYVPDYVPQTINYRYGSLQSRAFNCKYGVCYFVAPTVQGAPLKDLNGNATGVQVGRLDSSAIQAILEDNGVIIGAYMLPDELFSTTEFFMSRDLGTITGNPYTIFSDISGARFGKIKTGVYNRVILRTSQGSKEYNLEDFRGSVGGNITFGVVGILTPSPSIFIYPKNYLGVSENLNEGVMLNCPALPIATNATYTNLQKANDLISIIGGVAGGVVGGALQGGTIGGLPAAVVGGVVAGGSALFSAAKNKMNTVLQAPSIGSLGVPAIATNGTIEANLQVCSPDVDDTTAILNYFDYYGYNVQRERMFVIDEDGAYLQTGSEFLFGSEADRELNARLNAGIKIRKTLT